MKRGVESVEREVKCELRSARFEVWSVSLK